MPTQQGQYQIDPQTGAVIWVPFRDLGDPANVEPNRAPPRNRGDVLDNAVVDSLPVSGDWWQRFAGTVANPFAQAGADVVNWWNMVEPTEAGRPTTNPTNLDSVQTEPLSANQWNQYGQLGEDPSTIDPRVARIMEMLRPTGGGAAPQVDLVSPTYSADPSAGEMAAFYEEQQARLGPIYAQLEAEARKLDTSGDKWGTFFRMLGEMGAAESADPGSIGAAAWASLDGIDRRRREAMQAMFDVAMAREGMSERTARARADVSSGTWDAGERTRLADIDTRNRETEINTDLGFRAAQGARGENSAYNQLMAQMALDNLQNVDQTRMQVGIIVRQAATRNNWKRTLRTISQQLGIDMDFDNFSNNERSQAAQTLIARINSNRQALQMAPMVLGNFNAE